MNRLDMIHGTTRVRDRHARHRVRSGEDRRHAACDHRSL